METLKALETVLHNESDIPVILLIDGMIDRIYNIPKGAIVIDVAHEDDQDPETTVTRFKDSGERSFGDIDVETEYNKGAL